MGCAFSAAPFDCRMLPIYGLVWLVYWGLTPQQQPGSYQGGEMMMKSVFWWRKPEYPEETTDLRQVTDETFHTYGLCPVQGLNLGCSGVKQSVLRRDESGPIYGSHCLIWVCQLHLRCRRVANKNGLPNWN